MKTSPVILKMNGIILARNEFRWHTFQILFWVLAFALVVSLIVLPSIGLNSLWNLLVPILPAVFVFTPGIWRNTCPLSSSALFLEHQGKAQRKKLSTKWQEILTLASFLLLLLIIPLRHIVLDTNGLVTAIILISVASFAILMGSIFEMKSGWCATLCPVHPVEKLYGSQPLITSNNGHCASCVQCVTFCSDSIPDANVLLGKQNSLRKKAGHLFAGGFVGFIWGWFHVPNYQGLEGWSHLDIAYGLPFLGFLTSLSIYFLFQFLFPEIKEQTLLRIFSASAISCYYWYRLPALFGFGLFPGDGMLVDLRFFLPHSFPVLAKIFTTSLFFWWFFGRNATTNSWKIRPAYARKQNNISAATV